VLRLQCSEPDTGRQGRAQRVDRAHPADVGTEDRRGLLLQVRARAGGRAGLHQPPELVLQLLRLGFRRRSLRLGVRHLAVLEIGGAAEDHDRRDGRPDDPRVDARPRARHRRTARARQQVDDRAHSRAAERQADRGRKVRLEAGQLVGCETDVADPDQVVHERRFHRHADECGQPLGQPRKLRGAAGREHADESRRPRLVAVVVDRAAYLVEQQ
jgi:hypothetical protein